MIENQSPNFDVICNDHWSDRFLIEKELMKLPENYNPMGLPKWIGCSGMEEINKVKACVIEQIVAERWARAMPSVERPWF